MVCTNELMLESEQEITCDDKSEPRIAQHQDEDFGSAGTLGANLMHTGENNSESFTLTFSAGKGNIIAERSARSKEMIKIGHN